MSNYYLSHESLIDALMSYSWRDENDFSIDDADEKRKFIEGWFPNIPAADVAPVVHAHWEDVSVDDEGSMLIASMFCPNCKRWHNEVYHYGSPTEMAHYCPHCGARMDENEESK